VASTAHEGTVQAPSSAGKLYRNGGHEIQGQSHTISAWWLQQ